MNNHPGNFQNMPPSRPQGNQASGGMQKNGGASTEIRQFIMQLLQSQQHHVPMGWQATIVPQQRVAYIHQMVSALLLVKPDMGHQHAAHIALQYELGELQKAPDRDTYNNAIRQKLDDIQRTRQQQATLQEQQFQNSQAAQMMPNQQQIMAQRMAAQSQMQQGFGMQQPLQPGQIPVNPMQTQPPNHQQMARIGSGPDMQQTLRNNQPIQNMGRPMQTTRGPPQLNPQEQQHILNHANQIFQSMSPDEKNNIRNSIPPQQFQNMLAQGVNPIQTFCRNQIYKKFLDERERRQRNAQGFPLPGNAGMANQGRPPSQVSTGNPGQQAIPVSAPRLSDPSFALGNMDQFLGQQQDALRHQEAGQMVVPMSNPQGAPSQVRGTPNPQAHTQFNSNRPMPPPNTLPPQNPPFWMNQQNQQQNPHQTSQVQMQTPTQSFNGVPGQSAQLQGQMGGLSNNRPQRTPQQTHNMPTLNQPLDSKGQTQSDLTQRPNQPTPNMNQRKVPNAPQAAVPNVQQNSGQQRTQANPTPQVPAKGPPSWPPEFRARLMAMPENERNNLFKTMQQKQQQQRVKRMADAKGTANLANPEAPFQSGQQSVSAVVPVSQAKAPVGNPTTSQPPMNPTAAFNMQSQGNQQPMPSNGARNMPFKPVPIPLNEQQISQMDPMQFPPTIINRNSDLGNLPDDIRTWRQLKEHVQRNERELPPRSLIKVLGLQSIHYQLQMGKLQMGMLQRRLQQNQPQPQGSTGNAPVGQMIPQQINQPAQGLTTSAPNPFRFPALPEPTAQEVQTIRMTLPPHMKGLGDDQLRGLLMRQKQQEFFKTPQAQQAIREQQQQRSALQRVQNMEGQRNQFSGAPNQPGQLQQAQQAQVQAQQQGQPRSQAQQQPRQNIQPPKPAAGPAWTGGQPDVSKMNQKSLKRTSSEDVIEVPDPKLAQQQSRAPNPKAGQPPPMMPGQLTREQFARMTPEQKATLQRHFQSQVIQAGQRPKAAQASGQPGQHPMTANNANKNSGVPTTPRDNRYGQLMQEVAQTTPKRPEVPMSPKTRKQMIDRLSEKMSQMMKNVEKTLPTYLNMSKDENHTKELLRIRHILLQQVRDANFSMPVDNFTITLKELDQSESKMHEYIALMMKKTVGGQTQNMRPQQLNAANLQQQQEALNLQRARSVQKSHADNSNRAPAAPTTSHAPFAFGAQSPHGVPVYAKNELTQEKLVLPEKKKRRYNAASPATPAQTQTISTVKSSPGPKTESPEAQRTPAAPSVIKCPVPDCQSGAAGFVSREDLEKHTFEAHDPTHNIKDPLDAARYAIESLQIALNVDENGKPKPAAQEPKSENVTLQAVPMKTTVSSQGFKQEAATPMSRNPTQTGPSPSSNLLKTPQNAANVKTPASEAKLMGKDAAAVAINVPAETKVLPTAAPDPWANSHVKPEWFKEVFGGVADLNRQVPMDIVKDWFDRNPLTPPTSPSSGSAEKDSPHKSDISTNDELGIKLVATEDQDWVMADWFDESLHDDLANLEIPDIMDMDWDTAFGKVDDEENGGKGKKRDANETSDEWLRAWAPDKLEKSKKKGLGQTR